MPTYANSHVAKPKSWEEFEDIVCSAMKNRFKSPDFSMHGRRGQAQDGVDVYGDDQDGNLVGVQCKNTVAGITEATIRAEVEKAEAFEPPLGKLYIATTAESDAKIQAIVRMLSNERKAEGKFQVHILFWTDVWRDLTLDDGTLFQHFPQLKPAASTEKAAGPSHDQRLFEKFKGALPFNPSIRWLKAHDFNSSFYRSEYKPLVDFVETWEQPENEFNDTQLQDLAARFLQSALAMAGEVAVRTTPVGDGAMASVFSDHLRKSGARPDHVKEDARILNEMASKFVPSYDEFVRACRSKLDR